MNQDSSSSGESFSDIVLPSNVYNTRIIKSYKNHQIEIKETLNPKISYFTQFQNDCICQVVGSSNDKLYVRKAKLDESFSILPNNGDSPTNREGYCCVEIPPFQSTFNLSPVDKTEPNQSSVAVIGGVHSTHGATTMELFLYSLSNNEWKQISLIGSQIPTRSNHRAVALTKGEQAFIYIFGGARGLKLDSDLIFICVSGNCASCSKIEFDGTDHPCGRCDHSMTLVTTSDSNASVNQNLNSIATPPSSTQNVNPIGTNENANDNEIQQINFPVWALVFGGIVPEAENQSHNKYTTNGEVLGDLWKLEIQSPYDIPRWTLISHEGPPCRYSHASFYRNGRFFIAGGFDQNNQPLRDVWRYTFGFGWEQIAVFNNTNFLNVFGCPKYGFVEIRYESEDLDSSSILESSDVTESNSSRQNQLRGPISMETETGQQLFVRPTEMAPELALLGKEFQKLYQKQKNMYTSVASKKEEIAQLEKEIEIAQAYLNDQNKAKDPEISEYLKKFSDIDKLKNEISQLRGQVLIESKKVVLLQQENLLDPIPPTSHLSSLMDALQLKLILKNDKFEMRMNELKREQEMYSKQVELLGKAPKVSQSENTQVCVKIGQEFIDKLRELESIDVKNRASLRKIERMKKQLLENDELFNGLFQDISNYESLIAKTENKILDWEIKVQSSKNQLNKIQKILNVWESKPNDAAFQNSIETIQNESRAFDALISNNLKNYVNSTKSTYEALTSKLNEIYDILCDDSKKDFNECKPQLLEILSDPSFAQLVDSLVAP